MDFKQFVFIFLILAGLSFAAIPTSVTVHGKLTNANNVSQASRTINMTFAIYNVASAGVALYTKSNVNVATDYAGVYSYELTGITLPFDANYYLGVTVANDSEMTPRINITSNGYAYRANVSDTLMSSGNYVVATMNATTFHGNLAWSYLTSVPAIVINGSSANLSSLTVTGGNVNVTAGNITYVDRNGKTRVIQDTTQGVDEEFSNTLLDASRSTLTCAGSQLNYTLIALNGVGEWNFGGVFYGNALAVPNATVTLLNGTNSTPKVNYVHFYLNGGVPTMTTTEAYPSYTHIDVATFVVGETVGSECVVYAYSRNRYEIDSFVSRVIERFEETGTLYVSGFATTASTKTIQIGTGYFFNGIFEMFTNVTRNSTANGYYLINSTGNFKQITGLDGRTFSQYSGGEAVTDNRYLNVIWGIVPTSTTAAGTTATIPRLVAVVQAIPGTEYNSASLAEQDLYGVTNYYPSNPEVKNVFTPIARTIVLYRTGGGGTGTFQTFSSGALYKFVAGTVTSGGAPPTPGTSDHAVLSNLAWSTAGHTIDTAFYMNSNYIYGASYVNATTFYGNLNASYVQNAPWAIPGTATCSGVTVAQNVTTTTSGTTSQCITPPQGTVTSIIAGSGLTGGTITVSGTVAINDSYIIALLDNATIARNGTATCTGTDAAQNVTTSASGVTSQCIPVPQGTVTSVATDGSMIGGTFTTSGTLGVNTSIVALQNQSNTFAPNQTFSANLSVGAAEGCIYYGNGGYDCWNTTCVWRCLNATICSKLGTGC